MNPEPHTTTPAAPKRPKNESIETLRGLAILLVVLGHVIGIDDAGAMKVADDSIWRYIYVSTQYMCMPLFASISGWVYALRPIMPGEIGSSLLKKAQRLLVPLVCVGTLYFLVQYITPGTNQTGVLSEIWKIYVFPYTVFWYLPALFLMFAFVLLLDVRGLCNSVRSWAGCMAFACVLVGVQSHLSTSIPNYFSIWGAMALMPYFLLGVGVCRFSGLFTPAVKKYLLVGFVVCVVVQQTVWVTTGGSVAVHGWPLRLLIGITAVAFFLTHIWRSRFLIWIGSYAYGIYLFHAFGTSGGRIVLKMFGIHSETAIFAVALALGVCMPIVVEIVLRRFPLLSTLFLGDTFRMAKKGAQPGAGCESK